jgi:hypothetical protein
MILQPLLEEGVRKKYKQPLLNHVVKTVIGRHLTTVLR